MVDNSWTISLDLTVNFHHEHCIVPTECPWVSEDDKAVNKQLKANFTQAVSAELGTSYEKRAAHCKILEWQVMNKKTKEDNEW